MIDTLKPILSAWKKQPHKAALSRKRAWRTMRSALELPADAVPKTIRHTIATELRSRGVDKDLVETLLGQSFGSATTEVYAKYDPNFMGNLPSVLSDIFREILDESAKWSAVHLLSTGPNGIKIIVRKEVDK